MNLNDPSNPLAGRGSRVRAPPAGSRPFRPNSTIAYNLCGLGSKDCSIGVGTPSSRPAAAAAPRGARAGAVHVQVHQRHRRPWSRSCRPGTPSSRAMSAGKPPTGSPHPRTTTKAVDAGAGVRPQGAPAVARPPAARRRCPSRSRRRCREMAERARGRAGQRDHRPRPVPGAHRAGPGRQQGARAQPAVASVGVRGDLRS